uniref:Chemokine interleukin-8-like domain-containing protein n=1 Tax=Felis catus TaxID=9685 RepID=A0ABI7XIE6_FELCA
AIHLHLPLTHLVPQVKGTQIKGRGGGEERSIQAEQHEGALTHKQPPSATAAADPRPWSSITCCTQLYRQPLSNKLLRKVIRVELQEADGDCHLQAFVLHLSRRSVCIHPQNRSLARWFERQGRRFQGILPNLNLELIGKMDQGP